MISNDRKWKEFLILINCICILIILYVIVKILRWRYPKIKYERLLSCQRKNKQQRAYKLQAKSQIARTECSDDSENNSIGILDCAEAIHLLQKSVNTILEENNIISEEDETSTDCSSFEVIL